MSPSSLRSQGNVLVWLHAFDIRSCGRESGRGPNISSAFRNPKSFPSLSFSFLFLSFRNLKGHAQPKTTVVSPHISIQLFCYRHLCMWGSVRVCECACALSWTGCLLAVGFFYFLQCLPSPDTLIDKARSRYLWDKTICFFTWPCMSQEVHRATKVSVWKESWNNFWEWKARRKKEKVRERCLRNENNFSVLILD